MRDLMNILHLRINRYMLGCKCLYNIGGKDRQTELIDTCWDVNTFKNATNEPLKMN